MNGEVVECRWNPGFPHQSNNEWKLIFRVLEGTGENLPEYVAHCLDGRIEEVVEKIGSPIGFGLCIAAPNRFMLFEFPKRKNGIIDES